MAVLRNNAEGGATVGSGTVVTAANSGGLSGTAFNVVTGTSTFTFDNTDAHYGTYSYLYPAGAVTGYGQFTISSTHCSGVVYVKFAADPGAFDYSFARIYAGGTMQFSVGLATTKKLRVLQTGSATVGTVATAFPIGSWVRVEFDVTMSATVAVINADYYLGESVTPIETGIATTTGNTGAVTFDVLRVGKLTITGTNAYRVDDIAFDAASSGTYIGPAPSPSAPSVDAGVDQFPQAGASVTLASTESGTFSSGTWSCTEFPIGAVSPSIASASTASTTVTLTPTGPAVGGRYVFRRSLVWTGGTQVDSMTCWVHPASGADVLVYGEFDPSITTWSNDGGAANRTAALNDALTTTGIASPNNPANEEKRFIMRPWGLGPMSVYVEGYTRVATVTRTVTLYLEDGVTVADSWTQTPGLELANITEVQNVVDSGGLAVLTGANDAATYALRKALVVGVKSA